MLVSKGYSSFDAFDPKRGCTPLEYMMRIRIPYGASAITTLAALGNVRPDQNLSEGDVSEVRFRVYFGRSLVRMLLDRILHVE